MALMVAIVCLAIVEAMTIVRVLASILGCMVSMERYLEYFVILSDARYNDPDVWAQEMEAQGWHGIGASDHFWIGKSRFPHVFVTATRMACATSRIKITTSFSNNLFRSPVEFSQAALALQQTSGGRFEAGLGAGWEEDEMALSGMRYPDGPERMSRYIESLSVARQLLATGQCQHQGEFYTVDISGLVGIGPVSDTPPPLVGSVGGPRGLRQVPPLVDRVEIQSSARGIRGGRIDLGVVGTVTRDEIRRNIDRVKEAHPDKPLGMFIMTAVGDSETVRRIKAAYNDGYLGRFVGQPDEVASALEEISELELDRVQLTEMTPRSYEALSPSLIGGRQVVSMSV